MQAANALVHLIQQLDGPGRDPVGFVGSVKPVHVSSMMFYRLDFKHILGDVMRLFLTTTAVGNLRFAGLNQN
jgi:hypothetical protein